MSQNMTIPTSEYDEITRVVQDYYIEGLRAGSTATITKSFHKDAIMYGFTLDGTLLSGPIKNLYDIVDQYGDAPKLKTRVDILNITPTTALIKVEMENGTGGFDYTDFHTMMKFDGQWKIITKVFHTYKSRL
ncbi:Fc.00g114350.m01.CDS01 [Cosmosporella sp. VM-42]